MSAIEGPTLGPCESWITAADVADCGGIEIGSDNSALLDQVAVEASMLLYLASAQQFSGSCERTVRPCYTRKTCLHDWGSWYDDRGYLCGCGKLSEVDLGGYPVTEIVEVLLDGAVVDPSTYTLIGWQTLRRIRDPLDVNTALYWPACQDLTKPTSEVGTWQVTYLRGVAPPPSGERAAAALAAELYRACPGTNAGACLLPSSVTQITRQGVTMSFQGFRSFGFDGAKGAWNTGIALVDMFLNGFNPGGARRPAAFFSPDGPQFAERVL